MTKSECKVFCCVLLLASLAIGCRDGDFPDRQTVEVAEGKVLEVLEVDMDEGRCFFWYTSDIELSKPYAVKSRAHEIVVSYAGPLAVKESCTWLGLNAVAWRPNGEWVALEMSAELASNGQWYVR